MPRDDAIALVRDLPEHVLAVVDEAYFDYLEPGSGLDTIADLAGTGETAMALRTFSKLYGLAGLRVGYGVGPAAVVAAMRKVQRGYDVGALAQVAALASLGDEDEAARRREQNRLAMAALVEIVAAHGLEPLAGSATNFVLVDVVLGCRRGRARRCSGTGSPSSRAPRSGHPPRCGSAPARRPSWQRLDAALRAAGLSRS